MTRYAIRLVIGGDLGEVGRQFGDTFEIPHRDMLRLAPRDLQRMITEQLHRTLDRIIATAEREDERRGDAFLHNETLRTAEEQWTANPATQGDTLREADILRARQQMMQAEVDRLRHQLLERDRTTFGQFAEELQNFPPGGVRVEPNREQAEGVFARAREWAAQNLTPMGRRADFVALDEALPPTPARPRPAATHALWPLTEAEGR